MRIRKKSFECLACRPCPLGTPRPLSRTASGPQTVRSRPVRVGLPPDDSQGLREGARPLPGRAGVGHWGNVGTDAQRQRHGASLPRVALAESRDYIEYYGKLREAGLTDEGVFDAMVSRYPD